MAKIKTPLLYRILPYYLRTLSALSPRLAANQAFHYFSTPRRIPRPPSEAEAYEAAEKIWLENGLRGYRWGSAKNPVVVLLHGWNGRGTQLRAYSAPLTKLGYQVLALDGPAHGESPGKNTNPKDWANALRAVQNEIGPFHALVSHSFGAGCSVLAISEGLKVGKLVYIAGPCEYDQIVIRTAQRMGLNGKAKELFFAKMEAFTGRKLSEMNIGTLGKIHRVPTLIVHDNDDTEVRVAQANMLMAAWSGLTPEPRALITTGLGHVRILREPHVVEEVVGFIDEK